MKRMLHSATLILVLSLTGNPLAAQIDNNEFASGDLHLDYLSYNYLSCQEPPFRDDFKAFSILTTIPVKVLLIHPPAPPDKIYRITEEGSCQYRYHDESKSPLGFRPITVRTFYLEASRQGIIPASITYKQFISLPAAEKQALVMNKEPETPPVNIDTRTSFNAELSYIATSQGLKLLVKKGTWQIELVSDGRTESSGALLIKLLPVHRYVPLTVQTLINPFHGAALTSRLDYRKMGDLLRDAGEKTVSP